MAKMKTEVPQYGTIMQKGIQYYRTRIMDADGKQVSLYAATCEELYEKQLEARRQVEEIIFRRQHPTVAEYCQKWLLMQSAKVSASTLRGYTADMKNYIITPTLGMTQRNQPKIKYTLDFDVTPHQLRHTYITNLLYAGVDPKTVQYLAGHENSKTTMDIYAKVKYNKPEELFSVVNGAFHQNAAD